LVLASTMYSEILETLSLKGFDKINYTNTVMENKGNLLTKSTNSLLLAHTNFNGYEIAPI
jgi:hypothetical protein